MPKQKPQIDNYFLRILHVLGQEKYCSRRTRLLQSTIRGYHAFIKKPCYYIVQVRVITVHDKISAVNCSTVRGYHAINMFMETKVTTNF